MQPVHVGVHNAFGSNAKDRPVLEGGRTINHVIADAIDGKLKVAALPGSKRILQGIDLFCRKTSRIFEHGKDVVYAAHVRAAAVQYHTAIRQHGKGTAVPFKGRDLQGVHQIPVVVGDGNGFVIKALITAFFRGDCKHHDLRLVRDHRVCHDRLLLQDQLRQRPTQIKIASFTIQCDIGAIPRNEEKVCKMVFSLCLCKERADIGIALRAFQIRCPHPHDAPVERYLIVKGLVCLMVDLRKVCRAFLVDGVLHKIRKDNEARPNTDAEQQCCQNCEDTFFYRRPHRSFIFQEFILPVQWSDTRRGRGTAC